MEKFGLERKRIIGFLACNLLSSDINDEREVVMKKTGNFFLANPVL